MDKSEAERTKRMHDTLYGSPGKPEESLMVQIITTVKEVKRLRIAHDTMREEVSSNSRANKNLIRLSWVIIGLIATTIYEMFANG
jgi:hypothetical protein